MNRIHCSWIRFRHTDKNTTNPGRHSFAVRPAVPRFQASSTRISLMRIPEGGCVQMQHFRCSMIPTDCKCSRLKPNLVRMRSPKTVLGLRPGRGCLDQLSSSSNMSSLRNTSFKRFMTTSCSTGCRNMSEQRRADYPGADISELESETQVVSACFSLDSDLDRVVSLASGLRITLSYVLIRKEVCP